MRPHVPRADIERRIDRLVSRRWVDVGFGLFFIGLAIAVVVYAEADAGNGAWIVAGVLALLGVDAVQAAFAGRRSLLSRIGPLP